jgi:hypothetical protein
MQPVSLPVSEKDFGFKVTCPPGIAIFQSHIDYTEIGDFLDQKPFTKHEKQIFYLSLKKKQMQTEKLAKKNGHMSGFSMVHPSSGHWVIAVAIEDYWAPISVLSHEIYHLTRELERLRTPFFKRRVVKIDNAKGEELEAHLYEELFCTIYRAVLTKWPEWFDPRIRWHDAAR